jgi:hypothetical protein
MFAMEAARPEQIEALLEISRTKGRPLSVMVVEVARIVMDRLPWEERQEVIAQFKAEDGIDLEEFL